MDQVIVASAVRTPLGAFCGQLEGLSEQQLGAAAMAEAVRRSGIEPARIGEVIAGIAKQTSNPSNGGRHAMLLARLPETIPAYTVQLQSASGLQALASGYRAIRCGDAAVVLAGGMESMSRVPFEIRNARYDFSGPRREIVDAIPAQETGAQPVERYDVLTRESVAEEIARRYDISGDELTQCAEASRRKAVEAAEGGLSKDEILPLSVKKGKGTEAVEKDELPPRAALIAPPADGAAMCLLAKGEHAAGLPVLAEILAVGVAAAEPGHQETAVVKAAVTALVRARVTMQDLDLIELNETSAAEYLAILRKWEAQGLDQGALAERVNPLGGALAMGNPWGATGAILLVRAIHELRRRGGRIGMAALSAEGGQGLAMVFRNSV